MYLVYILRSVTTRRFYAGSTQDIPNRLREHNTGESKSTRAGIPWELVHREEYATRSLAMAQEKRIKARGIARYLADIGIELLA